MKGTQYFDPITKTWHDERPWPVGKEPPDFKIRVSTLFMDGMQRDIAAAPAARVLTDAEKRTERVQGYQDAFDHQRAGRPVGPTLYPTSGAYADMCARLQRGVA